VPRRISGLGEKIRKARRKLKWTQQELADFFGLGSKGTIAKYENNLLSPEEKILPWVKKVERLTAEEAQREFAKCARRQVSKKQNGNFSPGKIPMPINTYGGSGFQKNGNFPPGNLPKKRQSETSLVTSTEERPKIQDESEEEESNFKQRPINKRIRTTAKRHMGFPCPFCGNYTTDANGYYASLPRILIIRFVDLLKASDTEDYFNGVLDCVHAIFPFGNPAVKDTLRREGFLERYDKRHKTTNMEGDI